jgi:hypothetical protein
MVWPQWGKFITIELILASMIPAIALLSQNSGFQLPDGAEKLHQSG